MNRFERFIIQAFGFAGGHDLCHIAGRGNKKEVK